MDYLFPEKCQIYLGIERETNNIRRPGSPEDLVFAGAGFILITSEARNPA
jgi:hypothetical protein